MTKAIVHTDSFVIMLKFFIIKSGEKRCFEHLFYAKYIHTDIKEIRISVALQEGN